MCLQISPWDAFTLADQAAEQLARFAAQQIIFGLVDPVLNSADGRHRRARFV